MAQSDLDVNADADRRPDVSLPRRPYPGLRAFEKSEWPIFFGRESIASEIIERLANLHFVVIHGDSGAGKSSIVRAGVLPRLEHDLARSGVRWRTVGMMPRNSPLENLSDVLASVRDDVDKAGEALEIFRILNLGRAAAPLLAKRLRTGPTDNVCILVDQFEELFDLARRGGASEVRTFIDVMVGLEQAAAATDSDAEARAEAPGLYVLCTMRSEYLGVCSRYPGLAEAVNRAQYLVPRMERTDLLRAIRNPARLFGGDVDIRLAERLIAEVGEGQDQLPLIQHALAEMHERKVSSVADGTGTRQAREIAPWRLTMDDLPRSGGAARLLSNHADRIFGGIVERGKTPEDREFRAAVIERTFKALTDINADGHAIRRPLQFEQIKAVTGVQQSNVLLEILEPFRVEGVSFLRPLAEAPVEDQTLVDITHEAVIRSWRKISDPEKGWLQEEFRDGLVWKWLLFQAEVHEKDPEALISPATTNERAAWLAQQSDAWSARYGGGWQRVQALMGASERRADEIEERERKERRRELTRVEAINKLMFSIIGTSYAFFIGLWSGWSGSTEIFPLSGVEFVISGSLYGIAVGVAIFIATYSHFYLNARRSIRMISTFTAGWIICSGAFLSMNYFIFSRNILDLVDVLLLSAVFVVGFVISAQISDRNIYLLTARLSVAFIGVAISLLLPCEWSLIYARLLYFPQESCVTYALSCAFIIAFSPYAREYSDWFSKKLLSDSKRRETT